MSGSRKRLAVLGFSFVAVFALWTSAVVPAADAARAPDMKPHEETALRVRVLQSNLMVAALTCKMEGAYNATVTKFRSELTHHGRTLRGYFDRAYGSKGVSKLDNLVTQLANDAASRSNKQRRQFCTSARRVFDNVLALPADGFAGFAEQTKELGVGGPLPRIQ